MHISFSVSLLQTHFRVAAMITVVGRNPLNISYIDWCSSKIPKSLFLSVAEADEHTTIIKVCFIVS